ncbi:MAG: hypothetical protein MJ154_02025 [Candidatus Saccharibacteria bacterium]|nr:hypothetical protein [Candidatus Saccharibacteria bacterium]
MDQKDQANITETENGIVFAEPITEEKQQEQPKHKKNESKIVSLILAIMFAFLAGFAASQIDFTAVSDSIAGSNCEIKGELADFVDQLKLTKDGMRVLKASCPQIQQKDVFNENCSNTGISNAIVLGCYGAKKDKIYVYEIKDENLKAVGKSVLAHELLHAIWARASGSEKRKLEADLDKIYDENEEVRKSMSIYSNEKDASELHSVIGQSVSEDKMTEQLRAHYAKYFSDHSVIIGFYDQYYSLFGGMQQRINELKEKIEIEMAASNEEVAKHNSATATFKADVDSFNACARTRGCFKTQEAFDAEYNSLNQRREQLATDQQELAKKRKEINALISEYNEKVANLNKIQNSINSKYEPVEDLETN